MLNFILIGVCLLAGFLVKKYKALPKNSYKAVNAWVINIALPAMALRYIPEIQWSYSLIVPFVMPLLVWTGSYLFVNLISRYIQISPATRAALFLTAGLRNTSFLGFPLSEAYYGKEGLQIAILCDQATFIVMAIFEIITATKASNGGTFELEPVIKKILSFPPFIAFCLAFILPLFISFEPIKPLLTELADTLIPLALFSVGMQLKLRTWKTDAKMISVALNCKLLLAPLLILLLCLSFGLTGFTEKVTIFEAAMVTGAIIVTDYSLNPKLANIILSVGIPVSLVTTFLWSFSLNLSNSLSDLLFFA